MCTALSLQNHNGTYLFGRNMDIEYYFHQTPMVVPRKYEYENKATKELVTTKYALVGMGITVNGLPLLAEVMNEKGLACAGLNFPDAVWEEQCRAGAIHMPPYEFPLWITGNFERVGDVLDKLGDVSLVGVPVNEHFPLPTLHYMICDQYGHSVVVETKYGKLQVYDNPVGVMTNAPDFPWHLTNLRNYLGISSCDRDGFQLGQQELRPLGTGTGGMGLPGDFSSVSRFIRASFLRNRIELSHTNTGAVNGFFHILDNVAMVKGSVTTMQGHEDYTSYSSCMDLHAGIYYYKTYEHQQLRGISMMELDLDGDTIVQFPYEEEETIHMM